MPRHERPDPAVSLPVPETAGRVGAASKKAPWPAGLRASAREKPSCYLPEDLKVLLTKEAFEQLFGYAYATASEVSCLGSVRRESNVFVVERFHLVKQDGSSAHTEMDPSAVAELVERLLREGKAEEARAIKCWAHSHPGMGVFWSKTDEDTCRRLASDYLVSLVVSDDFAVRARIDAAVPLGITVDNVPVFCQVAADKAKVAEYEREVGEKVKPAGSFLFREANHQGGPAAVAADDPWSEYFGAAYRLFGDEETPELEAIRDEPEIPF